MHSLYFMVLLIPSPEHSLPKPMLSLQRISLLCVSDRVRFAGREEFGFSPVEIGEKILSMHLDRMTLERGSGCSYQKKDLDSGFQWNPKNKGSNWTIILNWKYRIHSKERDIACILWDSSKSLPACIISQCSFINSGLLQWRIADRPKIRWSLILSQLEAVPARNQK